MKNLSALALALVVLPLLGQDTNLRTQTEAVVNRLYKEDKRMLKTRLPDLVERMALQAGSQVADVGCGDGKFTAVLAHAVGKEGRVFAVDKDAKWALKEARKRTKKERLNNITFIAGTDDDPKLAPASLDAALSVIAYHEYEKYPVMLEKIKAALKPGGRLVVVDMMPRKTRTKDRKIQTEAHVIDPDIVQKELETAGFNVAQRDDNFINRPDDEDHNWLIVATR